MACLMFGARFLIIICHAGVVPGQAPDSTPADPAEESVRQETAPLVELATLPESAESRDPAQRLEELARERESLPPDDKLGLVRLLLSTANVCLAYRAEPFASRFLLGIESQDERKDWADLAALALGDLQLARKTLRALPDPVTEQEEAEVNRWSELCDVLESFAHLFNALAENSGQADAPALTEAAVELSEYLEAANRDIARYATFWQAVALRRMHRPDRALDLLEKPLSPPGPDPVAFFNRMERIRCLDDLDDTEAALLLALRLEEACTRWFRDEGRQSEYRRTATLLRLQLCDNARDNRRSSAAVGSDDPWETMCRRIRNTLLKDDPPRTVARLAAAMPFVVGDQAQTAESPLPPAPQTNDADVAEDLDDVDDEELKEAPDDPDFGPEELPEPHEQ